MSHYECAFFMYAEILGGCWGFSKNPTTGARTKKNKNQYAVPILDIRTYIPSAGFPPTYINTKKSNANNKTQILQAGLNKQDLILEVSNQGNKPRRAIALNIASTPPNLSGIALRIA